MTSYNTFIGIFTIEKKAFFIELQEISTIPKMRSDFAWEIKEKSNW